MRLEYRDGELYWRGMVDPAGSVTKAGYRRVCVNGEFHMAHRLIWEMIHGAIPEGLQVDHVDQDKLNNSIENLRLVTPFQNQQNSTLRVTNKSGYNGVCWEAGRSKWRVDIKVNGVKIYLGRFDDLEVAIKTRQEANLKFGFHKNHGQKKKGPL